MRRANQEWQVALSRTGFDVHAQLSALELEAAAWNMKQGRDSKRDSRLSGRRMSVSDVLGDRDFLQAKSELFAERERCARAQHALDCVTSFERVDAVRESLEAACEAHLSGLAALSGVQASDDMFQKVRALLDKFCAVPLSERSHLPAAGTARTARPIGRREGRAESIAPQLQR